MPTRRGPDCGLCAAVDVHYPRTGSVRAAAILAADAAFSHVLAERTAMLPAVPPYQPGEFYLRELPPLRAVLDGLSGLGLLVVDGYADLDPGGPDAAGPAWGLGAPVVRHRGRDAQRRGCGPGPTHGRPVPGPRRAAPR